MRVRVIKACFFPHHTKDGPTLSDLPPTHLQHWELPGRGQSQVLVLRPLPQHRHYAPFRSILRVPSKLHLLLEPIQCRLRSGNGKVKSVHATHETRGMLVEDALL